MATSRGRLLILFGSQSGCAEEVARALADEAARQLLEPVCCAMDEYDVLSLPTERLTVFVASTTGEGEVPDNMRAFWRFLLRKDLPAGALGSVHHACFGLGDSSYPKFNFAAKRLHRRLEQLGSTPLVPIGLGDDQDGLGTDYALTPWLASLWSALDGARPAPPGCVMRPVTERPPPRYEVAIVTAGPADDVTSCGGSSAAARQTGPPDARRTAAAAPSKRQPHLARVLANERLTAAGSGREVRHIELDLAGSGLSYVPGDALAVQPRNPEMPTRALLASLGLEPEAQLLMAPAQPHAAPLAVRSCSVLELFLSQLDVYGVPRRAFFALLAHFATDPMHRETLAELGSPKGASDLLDYAVRPRRTYAEVLTDFPSARPPVAYYLDLIPPLRERYFSIASSPHLHPTSVHLTVAIVRYRTMLAVPRFGVCSSYLAALEPSPQPEQMATDGPTEAPASSSAAVAALPPPPPATSTAPPPLPSKSSRVAVWLRRGCLTMPTDPAAPLIMIGPGTGVAPFRAFTQTRFAQRQAATAAAAAAGTAADTAPVGEAVLYFGCRKRSVDYLYEREWVDHLECQALQALHVAFSREAETKVYVQHKMVEQQSAPLLWRILSHPASHVYIAGAANQMPKDVRKALRAVAQTHGAMDEEASAAFLKQLEAERRLQCETW